MNAWIDSLKQALDGSPVFTASFTSFVRIFLPVLSFLILSGTFLSLLTLPRRKELFARFLKKDDGTSYPVNNLECLFGRSRSADICVRSGSVDRIHATLSGNGSGEWTVYDVDSKHGTFVNDREVTGETALHYGDTLRLGNVELLFQAVEPGEEAAVLRRRRVRVMPPWTALILLSVLQVCLCIQLCIEKNAEAVRTIVPVFAAYTALMWVYFLFMRLRRVRGFELEIIAFYLTSISLSVTTSCNWWHLKKQLYSIVFGILLMLFIGYLLRDLDTIRRVRWGMATVALALIACTLLLGSLKYGATNWINIRGISFQPSELAKLCYIFAGSATLDRLFRKRNLGLFIALSFCLMVGLAAMNDFGAAAVFFITFLVISFLRSGDFATLILFVGGAVSGGALILIAKPYIWARFSTWRHALENASAGGYQQARTLSAIASGGFLGVGPGGGFLKRVAAADTDLVFGMICEEWGLITAILAVLCIIVFSAFAIRSSLSCRSSFYMIAACSATSMIVFQTALNIFGCTDLLPLTGVTFPFVSDGGSSMLLSWGLLAFLKAADARPGASFVFRQSDRAQRKRLRGIVPTGSGDAETVMASDIDNSEESADDPDSDGS